MFFRKSRKILFLFLSKKRNKFGKNFFVLISCFFHFSKYRKKSKLFLDKKLLALREQKTSGYLSIDKKHCFSQSMKVFFLLKETFSLNCCKNLCFCEKKSKKIFKLLIYLLAKTKLNLCPIERKQIVSLLSRAKRMNFSILIEKLLRLIFIKEC